jgi:hypothetical protein
MRATLTREWTCASPSTVGMSTQSIGFDWKHASLDPFDKKKPRVTQVTPS